MPPDSHGTQGIDIILKGDRRSDVAATTGDDGDLPLQWGVAPVSLDVPDLRPANLLSPGPFASIAYQRDYVLGELKSYLATANPPNKRRLRHIGRQAMPFSNIAIFPRILRCG